MYFFRQQEKPNSFDANVWFICNNLSVPWFILVSKVSKIWRPWNWRFHILFIDLAYAKNVL